MENCPTFIILLVIVLFTSVFASPPRPDINKCQCHEHAVNCTPNITDLYPSSAYDNMSQPICVDCQNGTTGDQCERCKSGYYRHPSEKLDSPCNKCQCNPHGSLNSNCDQTTAQCKCREGSVGLKCDECDHGYFKTSAPVQPCIKIRFLKPGIPIKNFTGIQSKEETYYFKDCKACDYSRQRINKQSYCRADSVIKGRVLSIKEDKGWITIRISSAIVYKQNRFKSMSKVHIHNFQLRKEMLRCQCFGFQVGSSYMMMLQNEVTDASKTILIDDSISVKPWNYDIDMVVLLLSVDAIVNGCN
ncbi:Netrin unc-6 [Trichoplax sp. H2]|uniref:Laminin EGF-like domain-containing protein n=1 Tax=Trichoplax adhaerens TaxID=10228 RepID=B3RK07_TRIAD|nr:hypothetical protein TRIADDRAFT_51581 [Trichoplax adhaerens]EDV29351.1 hypothetical protein TRIADDRAFT_51581 [Trichoplax adhaerens]RDD41512.1 Netrin unc-6 [Trichoplax sp. H2]|eukprot:XP_002108553.1 hypothetical protein TRIADDRAFT_51581 [Trichoplax adhaerens]